MNEIIRELAQKAGLISSFNAAPYRPDIERFAEFLIQECANIASSTGEHGYIASQEMKVHFGIKKKDDKND